MPKAGRVRWGATEIHELIITHPQAQLEGGSVFFASLLLCVRPLFENHLAVQLRSAGSEAHTTQCIYLQSWQTLTVVAIIHPYNRYNR